MTTGGNDQLRALRAMTASRSRPGSPMTRTELAEAVNAQVWATTGQRTCLDGDAIGRYERGMVRWPSADYRAALRAVLGVTTDGDLGFHPTRRGVTAVPRTPPKPEDEAVPNHPENQADPVNRRDFLRTVGVLGAAAVAGADQSANTVGAAGAAGGSDLGLGLRAIRSALLTYPAVESPMSLVELATRSRAAHAAYQAARYADVARTLPGMIIAAATTRATAREQAVRSQALMVAAKMLTKVGDAQLAHIAADRALQAALQADQDGQHGLRAGAAYQVACAVLQTHGAEEAHEVSESAFAAAGSRGPLEISVKGALALISAIAAARGSDATAAQAWLARARGLADQLGREANFGWTAFGPTNVRIHEVSVAVELEQPDRAITLSETVDTDLLPGGLHSRRSQVHIDAAWAYAQTQSDPEAVISLLEAERYAPETVRHSAPVRAIITELVERRSSTPGLRALARRIGLAA